jgi:hypothetical protein
MLSIFVLTETIDYIAPFTSHAVAIQVLLSGREGEGCGSTQLWGVVPVKAGHIIHNMSDEIATLSRRDSEPIAI